MKNTEMKKRILELEDENSFLEFENTRLSNLASGRGDWMLFL